MENPEITFEEKVQYLKGLYANADPSALAQIQSWEERMSALTVQKDWLAHPSTEALRHVAEERLRGIRAVLAETEELPEAERKALFAERRAHLAYLAILTDDPGLELQSIERQINDELL